MKCDKCGYDDMGSGDTAHVCFPTYVKVRPTNHEVEIGRLTRKMNKVKDQRDKARKELQHYKTVLSELPYLKRRYDLYMELKEKQETMQALKLRVKEQSLLIAKLTGPSN